MSSRSLSSQGWRSLSVSGTPPFIFAIFAAGWKSSASWNSHASACANNWPIVVLPAPATPQIIITTGAIVLRKRAVDQLVDFNQYPVAHYSSIKDDPQTSNPSRACQKPSRTQHSATMHNPEDRSFIGHPRGLAYIAFTEAWERFSYYGMQALLVLYMVNRLLHPGHIERIAGFGPFRHLIEIFRGPLT